jgi:hypothetical protein
MEFFARFSNNPEEKFTPEDIILLLNNLAVQEKLIIQNGISRLRLRDDDHVDWNEDYYHKLFLDTFIELIENLKVNNPDFEEVLTKLKTYEFSPDSFSYNLLIIMLHKCEPELIVSFYEYFWIIMDNVFIYIMVVIILFLFINTVYYLKKIHKISKKNKL